MGADVEVCAAGCVSRIGIHFQSSGRAAIITLLGVSEMAQMFLSKDEIELLIKSVDGTASEAHMALLTRLCAQLQLHRRELPQDWRTAAKPQLLPDGAVNLTEAQDAKRRAQERKRNAAGRPSRIQRHLQRIDGHGEALALEVEDLMAELGDFDLEGLFKS